MLCSSSTFKFQKWFLHVLHSHDSSAAADTEIKWQSTQKSWVISSKSTEYIQCTPQKILEHTVIYIITMMTFCFSGNSIHQSHECPWNTKLVSLWPLSFYLFKLQIPLRCYWSTTKSNTEKLTSACLTLSYPGWPLCTGNKSLLSLHPLHWNKVVFSTE